MSAQPQAPSRPVPMHPAEPAARRKAMIEALQAPTPFDRIRFVPRNLRAEANADPRAPKVYRALALPYVDPRFIEERFDQACTPFGWQTKVEQIGDRLFVGLAILDPATATWIWRWDTGDDEGPIPTDGEEGAKQPGGKAIVSVGIKRCAYQFGVARDIYFLPRKFFRCEAVTKGRGLAFKKWIDDPAQAARAALEGRAQAARRNGNGG